tara:strand:+ start:5969 stop:6211 length:243 start_codon:yes stop_codon:yes gene_type:complete
MELKKLIASSYGEADKNFAGHGYDIERAVQSIVQANEEGVGLKKFLQIHKDYLISKNCSSEHIELQLEKVKNIDFYFKND